MANEIKNKLLVHYKESILAVGVYGSIGQGTDGPFSDIEMHVITDNHTELKGHEFVYDRFKIEISTRTKDEIFKKAMKVDDMWPIKTGSLIHVLPLYDPYKIFEDIKSLPQKVSDNEFKEVIKEFMIWEPYETMGKIRNNWENGNHSYLSMGARDLIWQTANL
jgi:kanamycin nucleotidyltransferase